MKKDKETVNSVSDVNGHHNSVYGKVVDKHKEIDKSTNYYGLDERQAAIHFCRELSDSDIDQKIAERTSDIICKHFDEKGESITDNIKSYIFDIASNKLAESALSIDTVNVSMENLRKEVNEKLNSISSDVNKFAEKIIDALQAENKSLREAIENVRNSSVYDSNGTYQTVMALLYKMNAKLPEYAKELDAAWGCLRSADFDGAKRYFTMSAKQNDLKADAYFGLALANNDIQLIWDYNENCEQPILYKSIETLQNGSDYKLACDYGTDVQNARYSKINAAIERISSKLAELEKTNQNYDCFICTKVTGKNGNTTDADWIKRCNLYDKLNKANIPTFYSEYDCPEQSIKGTPQYEASIFYALSRAKCMLIVCSKQEYLETPWVKNEYTRFCHLLQRRNQDVGQIVIVFDDDPVELPNKIRSGYQDIQRKGFDSFTEEEKNNWFDGLIKTIRNRVEIGKRYPNRYHKYCPKCGKEYGDTTLDSCGMPGCYSRLVSAFEYANIKWQEEKAKRVELEQELSDTKKYAEQANLELKKQVAELSDKITTLKAESETNLQMQKYTDESLINCNDKVFVGWHLPSEVVIPDGVESIGDNAFLGCGFIKSIDIPDTVTSIGERAFRTCSSLEEIVIPNGVERVGDKTFSFCKNIKSIEIPNSVTSIGIGAFMECISLEKIVIPNSVIDIAPFAFYRCFSLKSIVIPNSVKSIGHRAFEKCSSLISVTIGNGVEHICKHAFSNCRDLTSVTMGNGVTSIGDYAFFDCNTLTSVTIPNGVKNIGEGAFERCFSLKEIVIPNSVESIGDWAFNACNSSLVLYFHGTKKQWNQITKGKQLASDKGIYLSYRIKFINNKN